MSGKEWALHRLHVTQERVSARENAAPWGMPHSLSKFARECGAFCKCESHVRGF